MSSENEEEEVLDNDDDYENEGEEECKNFNNKWNKMKKSCSRNVNIIA